MAIRKKIGKLLDQLSDEELATAYRRPDFPGRSSGRAQWGTSSRETSSERPLCSRLPSSTR